MLRMTKPKFKKTLSKLHGYMKKEDKFVAILRTYGAQGVAALSNATPIDTRETAGAWSYTITKKGGQYHLAWTNSVMAGGVPLVILLQYGHATGTGGYVTGRNFVNPAMDPIFDGLKKSLVSEVLR